MRRCPSLALAGILLLATAAAPGPDGAIVDYKRPPPTFGAVSNETHYLRGGSIRIDQRIVQARTKLVLLRQRYTRPGQTFTFETTRAVNGRLVGVSAMDDPLTSPPSAALRRWIGPIETHLGERCRVWQAIRPTKLTGSFVQSGCATADGIELWRKQANIDAIFATHVRRVAVAPQAVRLPFEALDTAALMRVGAGTDHRRDYEAVLQGPGGQSALFRRSGNWLYVEENAPGVVSITIHNSATGVAISYSRGRDGTRRLGWSQPPFGANARGVELPGTPLPKTPARTILGERCTMRDLMAGVSDAGRIDCLTTDGIPLLSSRQSWGSGQTLTATRLSRASQSLSKVMLPAAVTKSAAWLTQ